MLAVTACAPRIPSLPATAAIAPPLSWRDGSAVDGVIDPRWWRSFGDPALDTLVDTALTRNTDVLTAVAVVEQSRAQIRLARSAMLPTLGGSASAIRSGGTHVPTTTALEAPLAAAWEIDLSGRLHALTRAARSNYHASQADRDAIALAVASQVAQVYIGLLSLDAQLDITRATLVSQARSLRLIEDQLRVGYVSQFELTQAQAEYELVAQQGPLIEQSVRAQENALALLVGDLPRAIVRGRTFDALALPVIPATLPAALLRRRPDIAVAEYRLAAANATIAARRADYLPQLNLSALFGVVASGPRNYNPVTIWSVGASLLVPLFEGGALRAGFDVATALRDQSAYQYRGVVLAAFGEVETAFSSATTLAVEQDTALRRLAILRHSLVLAQERYREGYSAYIDLLDAERSLYATQLSSTTTRQNQLDTAVALYAALGGGWSCATIPPKM
ncbi:efflux transporter outer membrane subunit [Polymorphobacter megasporae]|uniref:efflux transporter outer membrane subunit n=1 Tax=Glacieibacterium megasporae TaxID=2835787 RepID=UPI002103D6FA|nr:efflux transporter outer membrane subunit [Polymorphobacter megasporae]